MNPQRQSRLTRWPFTQHRSLAEVTETEDLRRRRRAGLITPRERASLAHLLRRARQAEGLRR